MQSDLDWLSCGVERAWARAAVVPSLFLRIDFNPCFFSAAPSQQPLSSTPCQEILLSRCASDVHGAFYRFATTALINAMQPNIFFINHFFHFSHTNAWKIFMTKHLKMPETKSSGGLTSIIHLFTCTKISNVYSGRWEKSKSNVYVDSHQALLSNCTLFTWSRIKRIQLWLLCTCMQFFRCRKHRITCPSSLFSLTVNTDTNDRTKTASCKHVNGRLLMKYTRKERSFWKTEGVYGAH